MLIPGLANLPRSGIISNAENFTWQKTAPRGSAAFADAPPPDQVLVNDDATEALVRILKRQHQDAAKKRADAKAPGKRPAEGPAGATGQKKLAISASLTAAAAAGTSAADATGTDPKRTYSQDELKGKTVKELQDLLKARGMLVSGKKEVLMQRMLDFQRRQKVAALGHG